MRYSKFFFLFLHLFLTSGLISSLQGSEVKLHFLEIDGIINPVVADYIAEKIKKVGKGETVIVRLNTPGGLMDSMQKIVQTILNAPNPVVVWVGPLGARAASAGVFITLAADIASMAPGTNIGAAHPVQISSPLLPEEKGTKEKDILEEKATQDAVAYIRAIAKEKNRNWQWAEEAVRKSSSITFQEALEKGVIEYIFVNLEELRNKLDDKKIKKLGREFVLRTKKVELVKHEMKPFRKFLNFIAHPNIAFILLSLGVLGLIYEFSSPGVGVGGIVGGIFLILAFFSLQLLPVNIAGVLLTVLGIILMALEVFTPGFGLLAIGGTVAFIFGALMLFDFPEKTLRVSLALILPTAGAVVSFVLLALGATVKTYRKKPVTGPAGLVGEKAVAKSEFNSPNQRGTVFVHGEYWNAELVNFSAGGEIKREEEVEIITVEGNLFKIKKIK